MAFGCRAYRAVDQHGQVIDLSVSNRRDGPATRRLFRCRHHFERYANNRTVASTAASTTGLDACTAYHRPHRSSIITGLAFLQNLRLGHCELSVETPRPLRGAAAFTELAL